MRAQIVAHVSRDATPALAIEARALVDAAGNIAEQLIALGFAPAIVLEACCAVTGLPPAQVGWLKEPQPPRVPRFDSSLCRRLGCAPVASHDGKPCVAFSDPEVASGHDSLGLPPHDAFLALSAPLQKAMSLLPEEEALDDSTRAVDTGSSDLEDATQAIDPAEAMAAARASMRVEEPVAAERVARVAETPAKQGVDDPTIALPTVDVGELANAPTIRQIDPPASSLQPFAPLEEPGEDVSEALLDDVDDVAAASTKDALAADEPGEVSARPAATPLTRANSDASDVPWAQFSKDLKPEIERVRPKQRVALTPSRRDPEPPMARQETPPPQPAPRAAGGFQVTSVADAVAGIAASAPQVRAPLPVPVPTALHAPSRSLRARLMRVRVPVAIACFVLVIVVAGVALRFAGVF
jgi:hypothetical protein